MTLFGALAEHSRNGKAVFGFVGELSPDGTMLVETPFHRIINVLYMIHATAVNPTPAPRTTQCTFRFEGSLVRVFGWEPGPGIVNPLRPTSGEETMSILVVGQPRKG